MPSRTLSWKQRFDSRRTTEIKTLEKPFAGLKPGDRMLISTPADIEGYVRRIPYGETRTVVQMRDDLAKVAGADVTCPTTTSVYLRVVAEHSLEGHATEPDRLVPFWRIVDPKSPLAKKLSYGPAFIVARRAAESGT